MNGPVSVLTGHSPAGGDVDARRRTRSRRATNGDSAGQAAWDYLIVTASNPQQAEAYRIQLEARRELDYLDSVDEVIVVPDPGGARVGSGGSTVACLMEVLRRRGDARQLADPQAWREIFGELRVMILHAGGDARRLPPYAPYGKLFVPLPDSAGPFGTLFDRQMPTYLSLPEPRAGQGQTVIAAGDVLLEFSPVDVALAPTGVTGLGVRAAARRCARHGVYRAGVDGRVERFLQKPSPGAQAAAGCTDATGRSVLDMGVMSFDAATAVRLLQLCQVQFDHDAALRWSGDTAFAVLSHGLDFYREIACALGAQTSEADYVDLARGAGSRWDHDRLCELYRHLREVDFHVHVLDRCRFHHFGTTRQLITSGRRLTRRKPAGGQAVRRLQINNQIGPAGSIVGDGAWIEGCRIQSPVTLGGDNVLVGLNVRRELSLPAGCCVDVVPGQDRADGRAFFVRCYGIGDDFNGGDWRRATFCNRSLRDWVDAMQLDEADLWADDVPPGERTLWNARLVPTETAAEAFDRWLWTFAPERATVAQRSAWRAADRYSFAEMAWRADPSTFLHRRAELGAGRLHRRGRRVFTRTSDLSAGEIAYLLAKVPSAGRWMAQLLNRAHRQSRHVADQNDVRQLALPRLLHSLGTAALRVAASAETAASNDIEPLRRGLTEPATDWLRALGVSLNEASTLQQCGRSLQSAAFATVQRIVVAENRPDTGDAAPRVRADEIVWGRAPARLDICGGWTDTPPYALEHGGRVLNMAVNLNGQPPIQVFARRIDEPVLRITSVDCSARCELASLAQLLDFRRVGNEFSLAKAAVALSCLAPAQLHDADGDLRQVLDGFGGGIELTTIAAIPKGSGLGTSSIMGAVLLSVLARARGATLASPALFHRVLQLEQLLTTGGGWQDQVGGVVGGAKLIATAAGLTPDPRIEFLPDTLLATPERAGSMLLYYTGITRVAKNLLRRVVARYLDREHTAIEALGQLRQLAPKAADALKRDDRPAFGRYVDAAWRLNKRLDPGCSTPEIEQVLKRAAPWIDGGKLLGAGGGGFLLLVGKSPEAAHELRRHLESDPPNDRARVFDFSVNRDGLRVTTC